MNDAVMALLVGSQLATNTLLLTDGSERTLGEIFPRVRHIPRFNLMPDRARRMLDDAESHLSVIAMPYMLTLQESLFTSFEEILKAANVAPQWTANQKRTSPVWIIQNHWKMQTKEGIDEPGWALYELLNEMRNDVIHRAGITGERTVEKAAALPVAARTLWAQKSKKPLPKFLLDIPHILDHGDMAVCFAIARSLAMAGNYRLQQLYPRINWLFESPMTSRTPKQDRIELLRN